MPSANNPILKPPPFTPAQISFILSPGYQEKLYDSVRKGSFDHIHQLQEATHGKPDAGVLKVTLDALKNCRVPERSELLRKTAEPVRRARFAALALQVVEDQCRSSEGKPRLVEQSGTLVLKFWSVLVDWFTFFLSTGTHLFDFLQLDPITVMKMPVINLMSIMKVYEGSRFDLRYPPGALELYILTWNCRDTDGTPIVIAKDGFDDGICPILTIIRRCTEEESIREKLLLKMITDNLLPLGTLVETLISRVVKVKGLYDAGELSAHWTLAFTFRMVGITLDFAQNNMVKNALVEAGFLRIYAGTLYDVTKNTSRQALNDLGWQMVADTLGLLLNWSLTFEPALLPKLVDLVRGNILGTTLRILANLSVENHEYSKTATSLNLFAVYASHPPLLSALHGPMEEIVTTSTLVQRASARSSQTAKGISNLIEAYYKNKECAQGRWKQTGKRRLCDNIMHSSRLREGRDSKSVSQTCSKCRSAVYCSQECQREDWIAHHRKECQSASQEYSHRKSSALWIRYSFRNHYFSMIEHFANKSRAFIIANFASRSSTPLIPIFDASMNPYDLKTVSIPDFRERGPLYKFRKERLNSYLDDYEQRSGTYLVGAVFFCGIERIHILARLVPVAGGSSHSEDTASFEVVGALIHYEHIREKDEEGRSGLYNLFTWSLNENVRKAMPHSQPDYRYTSPSKAKR